MSQADRNPPLIARLRAAVVVPVLTIDDPDVAVPLAEALRDGGLTLLEVTLRTPKSIEALAAMANVDGVEVGAGTVRSPDQAEAVIARGARFLVSPGMTPRLLQAAERWTVPFLPGVATASEAMALADLGYRALKLFPAEACGGASTLAALAAPLPDLTFCPTGGVTAQNARAYLALANVAAVGGSWVAPKAAVAKGDWAAIRALAQEAVALAS